MGTFRCYCISILCITLQIVNSVFFVRKSERWHILRVFFSVSVCFATLYFVCCLFQQKLAVVLHFMFLLVSASLLCISCVWVLFLFSTKNSGGDAFSAFSSLCVATLYFASQSRSPPFKCQRREHCLENVERHNWFLYCPLAPSKGAVNIHQIQKGCLKRDTIKKG